MSDPLNKAWGVEKFTVAQQQHIPILRQQLLQWHAKHGRHGLPWKTQDPYAIWISEIMLQQTQVSTGLIRFPQWMKTFPTIQDLAQASQQDVLMAWEGLGYYARARNLHSSAQWVVQVHQGKIPSAREERLKMKGVGPSTASAIGAFGFGHREAIWDGNVNRVWSRWWGDQVPALSTSEQPKFWWGWAQAATPEVPSEIRSWTQAIMDLGATVCTPKKPKCTECPWHTSCRAFALNKTEEWPIKKAKTKVTEWHLNWQWVEEDDQVWITQRQEGPWEGLWVLPDYPLPPNTAEAPWSTGVHQLSHRTIHWKIFKGLSSSLGGQGIQVAKSDLHQYPMPKPLREWVSACLKVSKHNLAITEASSKD